VTKFRHFFWPLISQLIRPAIASAGNSVEILELCFDMLQTLEEAQFEGLNLKQLSNDWFSLVLDYTTTEVRRRLPGTYRHQPLTFSPSGSNQTRRT
jgi:ubiquitin carboxyl-terminal hydrolase 34